MTDAKGAKSDIGFTAEVPYIALQPTSSTDLEHMALALEYAAALNWKNETLANALLGVATPMTLLQTAVSVQELYVQQLKLNQKPERV